MLVSKCHHDDYKVVGGDEGTNHWECVKCREACDVVESCEEHRIDPEWDYCPYCGKPIAEKTKLEALKEMEAQLSGYQKARAESEIL